MSLRLSFTKKKRGNMNDEEVKSEGGRSLRRRNSSIGSSLGSITDLEFSDRLSLKRWTN